MSIPRETPIPRPEPGAHTGRIADLDVDRDGRFVVTAGEDKTARVWAADTGTLLRTLRPPINDGEDGRLSVVAIAPDGALVATGGPTTGYGDHTVHVFDRVTGRLAKRLDGVTGPVRGLAFSPDGGRLAAAIDGRPGMVVWWVADWTIQAADSASLEAVALGFDRNGRLAVADRDGSLHLYDRDSQNLVTRSATTPPPPTPTKIVFAPDGRELAIIRDGQSDGLVIVSAADFAPLLVPSQGAPNEGHLTQVAWSIDGRTLYAAGRGGDGQQGLIRAWSDGGRGAPADVAVTDGVITALRSTIPDALLFATEMPSWGEITHSGALEMRVGPAIADFRHLDQGFALLADAGTVGIALGRDRRVVFSLSERSCRPWAGGSSAPKPCAISKSSMPVGCGAPSGAEVTDAEPLPSGSARVTAAAPFRAALRSADGRVVVMALADGTLRWYRAEGQRELLALFLHADGERWVAWTPSGYYMASAGGETLLGWHVNNGPEREADFFAAARLRQRFMRPDIVTRILETLDEGEALRLAERESLRAALPPVLRIVAPEDGARVSSESVVVSFDVARPSDPEAQIPVEVRVRVDGRPIPGEPVFRAIPGRTTRIAVPLPDPWTDGVAGDSEDDRPVHVSLLPVSSDGRFGEPDACRLTVSRGFAPPPSRARRQRLYLLSCGLSDHVDSRLRLRYGHKDALDIAAFFEWQRNTGRFESVNIRVLTDRHVTRDTLRDGLAWLRTSAEPGDLVLLFLAGHGLSSERGEFYFLTADVEPERPDRRALAGLELADALSGVRGKVAAFLDVARSGFLHPDTPPPDVDPLINQLSSTEHGVVTFTATTGRQHSTESADWRNGLFAKALLDGLDGAVVDTDGAVRAKHLGRYLRDHVGLLSEGRQSAAMLSPPDSGDLQLAFGREMDTP